MKKTAVVVIPIYRKFVPSEAFSFSQCLKVLSRYDISLLHPERLDLSDVLESTPPNVSEIVLPDSWFESIASYNKLCLSPMFYGLYGDYEYMLIYQLDAFVFRDELADWCAMGYDYIGAPWLPNTNLYECSICEVVRLIKRHVTPPGTTEHVSHAQMHYHVGNGGFSLRKVSKLKAVVTEHDRLIADMKEGERRSMEEIFFSVYMSRRACIAIPEWREALRFAF